ncbi:hypothetical protein HOQ54_gp06 [uncultured phage MedDCM-OCT-S46-C10]|jgi:hypothetical protein|uniref:Uncharacterized protein n=1 Tax=uncultured phage MedDCM-OCT-S46-C10 TaxID=2741074 RepID=A0A6S4PA08_9CAUD|nr:hypothetical protein HOQ54_gp06 [uncultured phage_MedDCM-OCT-S46-C10]BAQ94292.1 hypothetical protein [uncultured phage_MedDCM-OCT-S46-C10]
MIIYGYTPKMWLNRGLSYIKNMDKRIIALFIAWSIILWVM